MRSLLFFALAGCSDYNLTRQLEVDDLPDSDVPVVENPDVPVAVCSVSPDSVRPPFESATWEGNESYDPQGEAIKTYSWTLVSQPLGSAVVMPSGNGPERTFMPDLAGDYVGQLVVSTADGRVSTPCEVTLEAIPVQDLWVEMFWTHAGDDMDLHLLAPGGTFGSNKDCHWENCVSANGLNWGSSTSTDDNPRLDLDNIPGTGPENINIAQPAAGKYTIIVHDYPESTYNGANDVTVNVYMNGQLEWSDTRAIAGEDVEESFATIDWTTGIVTDL